MIDLDDFIMILFGVFCATIVVLNTIQLWTYSPWLPVLLVGVLVGGAYLLKKSKRSKRW